MSNVTIHSKSLRLQHWVNVLATLTLIASGWQIYNASPILTFRFPAGVTLGGWLGGALLWHFAAMWLLIGNGTVYMVAGLVSGRLKRNLLPLSFTDLAADFKAAVQGRLVHADLSHYNAVQKFSYIGVLILLSLAVASGLAVWKPVQLHPLSELFGGFAGSRIVHFAAMSGIVLFIVVHVGMSLLVPRSLLAMVRGR
jgi:thiosulfate reductase cytochrome b subunit